LRPRRELLLDRDGVIKLRSGYVSRVGDCSFIDGIFESARAFAATASSSRTP